MTEFLNDWISEWMNYTCIELVNGWSIELMNKWLIKCINIRKITTIFEGNERKHICATFQKDYAYFERSWKAAIAPVTAWFAPTMCVFCFCRCQLSSLLRWANYVEYACAQSTLQFYILSRSIYCCHSKVGVWSWQLKGGISFCCRPANIIMYLWFRVWFMYATKKKSRTAW
jgi:hypothetical protein